MTPTNLTQPELQTETEIATQKFDKSAYVLTRMRVSRPVRRGMFDTPEIVAVSIAGLTLLAVVFAYLLMLLPAREEFKKYEADRSQKQTQLLDLQTKAQIAETSAAGTVDVMSSVDRFESNFLPLGVNGNAALYQRLNELIRSNNLRNTAGPQYSSLEMIEPSKAAKILERRGNGKQPGIFPGTYVTVTVEGNYASLRHFISDLEGTRQYLVINSIEIEPNTSGENSVSTAPKTSETGGLPTFPEYPNGMPNTQMQSGKPNPRLNGGSPATTATAPLPAATNQARRGIAVSLQLEMAAYFRRSNSSSNAPESLKTQN